MIVTVLPFTFTLIFGVLVANCTAYRWTTFSAAFFVVSSLEVTSMSCADPVHVREQCRTGNLERALLRRALRTDAKHVAQGAHLLG